MEYSINADLHNHTTGSDGKQSPLMFLLRAKNRGRKVVSITDHSSIKGYKQLEKQIRYYAKKSLNEKNVITAKRLLNVLDSLNLMTGVEVITSYKGIIIEIHGYDIDIDKLNAKLQEKSKELEPVNKVLYEGLNKGITNTGITFNRDVLENVDEDRLLWVFYEELMSHEENRRIFGNITNVDTLKKFIYNYLYNPKSPFFVDMSSTRPTIQDVIQCIHEAGGKAVLAHPVRYNQLDMRKEIDEIIKLGLDGLEVYYPDQNKEYREFLLQKVIEYGLISTGGSDDHRNYKEGKQYRMGIIDLPDAEETKWIKETRNFLDENEEISDFRKKLRVMVDSSPNSKSKSSNVKRNEQRSEER